MSVAEPIIYNGDLVGNEKVQNLRNIIKEHGTAGWDETWSVWIYISLLCSDRIGRQEKECDAVG